MLPHASTQLIHNAGFPGPHLSFYYMLQRVEDEYSKDRKQKVLPAKKACMLHCDPQPSTVFSSFWALLPDTHLSRLV